MINTFDALAPQRVSGALDYTAWPSVLPTQSEAWSGSDRFRTCAVTAWNSFCKFQVTDIKAETVAAGKTYTMAEKTATPAGAWLRAQADAYRHRHCRGRGTMRETYVDL